MKIYTRTGDGGESRLFGGVKVQKSSDRLHAYGTIDELNAILGLARSYESLPRDTADQVMNIQSDLFIVGADLATPLESGASTGRMTAEPTKKLEEWIDAMEKTLSPLTTFILPAGSQVACSLHLARTVCRRAERWMTLVRHTEPLNEHLLPYVNRLSDYLFVAARYANASLGITDEEVRVKRA